MTEAREVQRLVMPCCDVCGRVLTVADVRADSCVLRIEDPEVDGVSNSVAIAELFRRLAEDDELTVTDPWTELSFVLDADKAAQIWAFVDAELTVAG